MKARVDSKEFTSAMGQALKWTRVTGVDVSGMVMLTAIDGYLLIRTTILDGDSILAVNAWDVEHGEVITRASYLKEFSWGADGWLNISSNKKLRLEYEDFASPELSTIKKADFPLMLEIPHQVTLTKDILARAAVHTLPMADTGLAIKSAVHIVPVEGGVAVVGADGVVGYRKDVEGVEIEKPISIEATTLTQALGGIGETVVVGIKEHRVEVAARDAPSRIQFSSVTCPDPSTMPKFFELDTHGEPFEIDSAEMKKIAFLARKAAAIDPAAELLVAGEGTVTGEILGQDITIPKFNICEGETPPIVFRCDSISRALSMLSGAESYKVSMRFMNDDPQLWFIDGDGRHSIMAAAPQRFELG